MSEEDSELYEKYLNSVGKEISTLRVILEGVEAKAKERVWMIHQSSGDFDDRKIVEGITGERSIYKKVKNFEWLQKKNLPRSHSRNFKRRNALIFWINDN